MFKSVTNESVSHGPANSVWEAICTMPSVEDQPTSEKMRERWNECSGYHVLDCETGDKLFVRFEGDRMIPTDKNGKSLLPEGYEWTGEYRNPKYGEWIYPFHHVGSGVTECNIDWAGIDWAGNDDHRYILRKVEPKLWGLKLGKSDIVYGMDNYGRDSFVWHPLDKDFGSYCTSIKEAEEFLMRRLRDYPGDGNKVRIVRTTPDGKEIKDEVKTPRETFTLADLVAAKCPWEGIEFFRGCTSTLYSKIPIKHAYVMLRQNNKPACWLKWFSENIAPEPVKELKEIELKPDDLNPSGRDLEDLGINALKKTAYNAFLDIALNRYWGDRTEQNVSLQNKIRRAFSETLEKHGLVDKRFSKEW